MIAPQDRVRGLSCWSGPIEPVPLGGGITNHNFRVDDRGGRFVVRIGADIPVHQVMRFNEVAAARAAEKAGIGPAIVHAEPGALVMRFIEGQALAPEDVRKPAMLERILELVVRCHHEVPLHLRGPVLAFNVFHVVRDYAHTLEEGASRMRPALGRLLEIAGTLEEAVGPTTIVFGHNDLLAANLLDDGRQLWLIDWEYAGFNSPLFDLANLASNNDLDTGHVRRLLEGYFGRGDDPRLLRGFSAMRCASLLREAMWSMVSEIHSTLDFDYAAYTAQNLERFQTAWAGFSEEP
jgi:thiamine kinase-like enzyme